MEGTYQVVIIGGGPGSATAAYYLARAGVRTAMIEKEEFPRYAVGESLLPRNMGIFEDMGLAEAFEREFLRKDGAVFANADSETFARINFADGLPSEHTYAYQVPRDRFDVILQEHACEAGAELLRGTVRGLIEEDGRTVGVAMADRDGSMRRLGAELVVDASGRGAFIGRKLGLMVHDPKLDTAAVFGLFRGVEAPVEAKRGDVVILAFDVGWFWFIPFADGRTSVGAVVDREVYDAFPERSAEAIFAGLVRRAAGRVPELMVQAERIDDLHVLRRFNRKASRFAGPGWVLLGDAAMFVDPVFSAGVLAATTEGKLVAEIVAPLLKAGTRIDPEHFEQYTATIESGYELLFPYIVGWKDEIFRKFFTKPGRATRTVQTVITVLSGGTFSPDFPKDGAAGFWRVIKLYRFWRRLTTPFRWLVARSSAA